MVDAPQNQGLLGCIALRSRRTGGRSGNGQSWTGCHARRAAAAKSAGRAACSAWRLLSIFVAVTT
jgi:hypothetical protein